MGIRSSPPIKCRSHAQQARGGHRFTVRDKLEADPPPRSGGATRILKGAFVVLLLLAGSISIWSAMRGPDPHYVAARKMVSDYEFGKTKQVMNYEDPVYGGALQELTLVDPNSDSVEAAEALRDEIERNIAEFRHHQARLAECLNENRSKKTKREAAEFQTRAYSKLIPFDHADHPECE